ncbi:uncharacterized protein LOC130891978 [Diorhabda carinulata]|uniref:uncharacterized protein LOC130891978 n=1 Tax=Diorhabda carinulata TaxID=1163345 RepID=UPI0025A04380|nr:uncharacterized protein LOC130891978 [Diorhabda carinulata]XP_057653102.1 uncharacterized protein LOC130891978 [Diorhabda carinulata]XP_057653105.1 uncharacterized protein LOC130891978 [Diorhabda carinulata]
MLFKVILLFFSASFVAAYPRDTSQLNNLDFDQRPLLFYLEQQSQEKTNLPRRDPQPEQPQSQQQQVYQPGGYQYVNPQYQYTGYNQQTFPRIQPSILIYGAGGQGQPILINPGSPPGNFLIPQQPGVIYGNNPQNPVFVGGYPNPKPAHIPPIEKDAEEIPTNPANIPPFPTKSTENKPEKLETFNEDRFDPIPKSAGGEGEVFEQSDRKPYPQSPNRDNLKPGQRFFILNGQPLYQNYPPNYPELPAFTYQQLQDKPQEFGYNFPVQTVLLKTAGDLNQQPKAAETAFADQFPHNFISLNQPIIPQGGSLFTTGVDLDNRNVGPIGQFRFTPPNNAFFPGQEDIENDSVVVNANFEDDKVNTGSSSLTKDASQSTEKTTEPGTAQAAPSAVALAGTGGVAGAAPRATALVGKGGLAVSSPQATAISGTKKDDNDNKDKQEKKPGDQSRN